MVEENVIKLRRAQLMIAKEIKRICDLNNINYFLDSGSMLGAVRHSGFIPWDDDMDIGMCCDDYEKFISIEIKIWNIMKFLLTCFPTIIFPIILWREKLKDLKWHFWHRQSCRNLDIKYGKEKV